MLCRPSKHSLAIETGQHRQTWFSFERVSASTAVWEWWKQSCTSSRNMKPSETTIISKLIKYSPKICRLLMDSWGTTITKNTKWSFDKDTHTTNPPLHLNVDNVELSSLVNLYFKYFNIFNVFLLYCLFKSNAISVVLNYFLLF